MSEDNFISAQEMIMTAYANIERVEYEKNNKLLKSWSYIIKSIKSNGINGENLGLNLYSHSRIIDLKNEILLIEADHPGWIQTLRLYQKYILTGLKRGVPELKINSLAFRMKGTDVKLHEALSEEKIKEEIKTRIESEENIIKDFDNKNKIIQKYESEENSGEKKKLPENLQKILDRLKSDMLTNGE